MSAPPARWQYPAARVLPDGAFYVPAMAATGKLEVTTCCVPT
jgi:hypothetical protein